MNLDAAGLPPLATLNLSETFAGPKEELDKLQAINWSLVSSTDGSSYNDFVSVTRLSDNSLTLGVLHHHPI